MNNLRFYFVNVYKRTFVCNIIYLREVLKIVILSEAKNPDFFKINKIDSSLRSE